MLRRRSVAIELRLRADAEAKKAAKARLKSIMLRFTTGTLAGRRLFINDFIGRDDYILNNLFSESYFPYF